MIRSSCICASFSASGLPEACGGPRHRERVLARLGHRVKLIPPQYIEPFVKRNKNDRNDTETICEAASRPTTRSMPVKTVSGQAAAMLVKYRELVVRQCTQAINSRRGHTAE